MLRLNYTRLQPVGYTKCITQSNNNSMRSNFNWFLMQVQTLSSKKIWRTLDIRRDRVLKIHNEIIASAAQTLFISLLFLCRSLKKRKRKRTAWLWARTCWSDWRKCATRSPTLWATCAARGWWSAWRWCRTPRRAPPCRRRTSSRSGRSARTAACSSDAADSTETWVFFFYKKLRLLNKKKTWTQVQNRFFSVFQDKS